LAIEGYDPLPTLSPARLEGASALPAGWVPLAEAVKASRRQQGLPEHVEDSGVVEQVAGMVQKAPAG
jgi:hypothetical protein